MMQCCTMEICSNLQNGKTIIVMHYATLLDHLPKSLKKMPRLEHKKILFHQFTKTTHHPTNQLRKKKLHEFGFQLAPCFLYFLGLVSSDLFCFANLKIWLSRRNCHPVKMPSLLFVHILLHITIPNFVMGESSAQLLMETALTKMNLFSKRC